MVPFIFNNNSLPENTIKHCNILLKQGKDQNAVAVLTGPELIWVGDYKHISCLCGSGTYRLLKTKFKATDH